MALQLRRVTEEQRQESTFVPVIGEPVYAYDSGKLYIGDGTTVGGVNIADTIALEAFLGITPDGGELFDGAFIYFSESDNSWHIGQPTKNTSDLSDVTPSSELDEDFMIAYNTASQKWVIQERLSKSITEVEEFSVQETYPSNGRLLLQYNETTEKFESIAPPAAPTPPDLEGMRQDGDIKRGHLWKYDATSSEFVNDYIVGTTGQPTFANLFGASSKDIISYSENGLWEKETPFLKDVELISIEGLDEEPDPVTILVTAAEDGRYLLNGSLRPALTLNADITYIFDLSDITMDGKNFRFGNVYDGTHDPSGSIIEDTDRVVIEGTAGVDGTITILRQPELVYNQAGSYYYYFDVDEPEKGNSILVEKQAKPYVMEWDGTVSAFRPIRFFKDLSDFGNVIISYDENGLLRDQQILAWNAGLEKWTTPGNMVPGVTGELPRRQSLATSAVWKGDFAGIGSFDLALDPDSELLSLKLDGPEDGEADLYLFETEELREDFFELLEELLEGVEKTLESIALAADEAASQVGARKARMVGKELKYAGKGNSLGGPASFAEAWASGVDGGGAGGSGGTDLTPGSFPGGGLGGGGLELGGPCQTLGCGEGTSEPELDDFLAYLDPNEAEDIIEGAVANLEKNLNKLIGAIVARNKAIADLLGPESVSGGGGDTLGIGGDAHNYVSDPAPPMIFGWRPATDYYGYYLFTYESSASPIFFNTKDHYLSVQSRMRRVGCILNASTTFRVVFYYDADDTRYKAGPWLRIVEYQRGPADYTGNLSESPSYFLRQNIEEYDPSLKYKFGARVIYNDKLWELLLPESVGVTPGAGTELAPTVFENQQIQMFVEIPAFSVKSQVFNQAGIGEGVYQMRLTLGKDGDGGKTHPAFQFGNVTYDDCDFLYVGVNLLNQNQLTRLEFVNSGNSSSYTNIRLDTRSGHRDYLGARSYDIGMFLYDINVHSAIQHLMVGEFQTFNIESRLGQCDLVATQRQYWGECQFSLDLGNASGCTQSTNSYNNPAGIVSYRGIHRPYGNQGFHLDSLNIRSDTAAAKITKDPLIPNDIDSEPSTFYEIENLPKPTLTALGDGEAFISNFYIFRRVDYSDFVYFLPKSLGGSYDSYLGDRIKYRRIPNTDTLAFASCGSPFQTPINQASGENGPFNMNISPATGIANVFGTRLCVKRRGAPKPVEAKGTISQSVGTTRDENGDIVSQDAPPPYAIDENGDPTGPAWPEGWTYEETDVQTVETNADAPTAELEPGQSWELDSVVVGNDKASNSVGVSTVSVARKVLSQSAICIGVIDESSNNSIAEFLNKWNDFREQFPTREFWLLNPTQTDPLKTRPFPTSTLTSKTGWNSDFEPVSYNQKSSLPLTYKILNKPSAWSSSTELNSYPVWVTPSDNNAGPNEGALIEINYKVKFPEVQNSGYGTRWVFVADNYVKVEIYNPITDTTHLIGESTSTLNGSTPVFNEVTVDFTDIQTEQMFTPNDILNSLNDLGEDLWLEITATVENTDINASTYTANPGAFALRIEGNPYEDGAAGSDFYEIFNAWDWASIPSALYATYAYQALRVPGNYTSDFDYANGPYVVTRDGGSTASITDWFALCRLDRFARGTIIGLFIDRSGSMNQATIQASYTDFYSQCEEAGLTIREVQNTQEDWIEPFFADL